MDSQVKVVLGPVQETSLLTLYGRAWVTKRAPSLLSDEKAVDLVQRLDFDFSRWDGLASLFALAVRARVFDEQVQSFLAQHPEGSVVELGVGLNTRYERVDNGKAHWLELDLPDVISLRRSFFQDSHRRKIRAFDLSDENWFSLLNEVPSPYLFVSEGSLIYLSASDVQSVLASLATAYAGSRVLLDTASTAMVESQDRHDAMRTFDSSAWFRWKCDDPRTMESWGMRCVSSMGVDEVSPKIRQSMPWKLRFVYALMPWWVKRLARGYRISLFELDAMPREQVFQNAA